MWSGIWSVASARICFWTWIWFSRHCGVGQEVACWFQYLKNWLCLTSLITLVLSMWEWMGLFLRKSHLLRYWGCLSLLKWIEVFTNFPLLKLEPWFVLSWPTQKQVMVLWSFFLLRVFCISINLPYGLA